MARVYLLYLMEVKNMNEHITGAIWGAVLGDVIGAPLQFDKDITPDKIKKAFNISGGGKHHLDPGQPTDDSQLAFSVMRGLSRAKGTLNLNLIAEQMGNWFLSKPFDIGNTIRNSVPKACNMKEHQAHCCRKGAFQRSQSSQSNGSLMGIIGLSIWCYSLSPQDLITAVKQYTLLIHSNPLVAYANAFYSLMVQFLLNNITDPERAAHSFDYAKQMLFQKCKNQEFKGWIDLMERSFDNLELLEKQVPVQKCSGWVRVALSYAVHFLIKGISFRESIKWIVSQKGDPDTNACIMGGLLGAYYGITKLEMNNEIQKIIQWKSKIRPKWLNPGLVVPQYIDFLCKSSPSTLKMVGSSGDYPAMVKK